MRNKKRFTKLAALALVATMLSGSATVVSAHEVENITDANVLRGALCQDCGYGQMVRKEGDWHYTSSGYENVPCSHYPHGSDKVRYQRRYIDSVCNYCGVSLREKTEFRTILLECHGYH